MSAGIIWMDAVGFRLFRRENFIARCDDAIGIAWFADADGRVRCVDRTALWNAGAGGVDDVFVVVADSCEEATHEISRERARAQWTGASPVA